MNPNWLKSYLRIANALLQLVNQPGTCERAIKVLKEALELQFDENSKEIQEEMKLMLESAQEEHKLDTQLPMDHPERARYGTMLEWMA